jgi:hypothetical protein
MGAAVAGARVDGACVNGDVVSTEGTIPPLIVMLEGVGRGVVLAGARCGKKGAETGVQ